MRSDPVETVTSNWAKRLGQEHCTRDESAARLATSQRQDAAQATAASVERWVTIVAAIRRLADAYNAGAFDNSVMALLHKVGGQWRVVQYVIGATDVAYIGWDRRFHAPLAIFPH